MAVTAVPERGRSTPRPATAACSRTSAGSPWCCCCRRRSCSACSSPIRSSTASCCRSRSTRVGVPGEFVGLKNFVKIWNDIIFRTAVWNTFWYTVVTTVFKLALGLWLAMLLNRHFRGKALVRAFILLPFIIPDRAVDLRLEVDVRSDLQRPQLDALPARPHHHAHQLAGRSRPRHDLDHHRQHLARRAVLRHHACWPACRRSAPSCNEAAAIDGARPWNRFWYVTWPLLLPVTMVVMLFSVIQTFADFQLVYVMTGGGPANATHLFATYAYQLGIGTGLLSEGAAISLAMFPFLFLIVVVQLLYIRRVETLMTAAAMIEGAALAEVGVLQHPADPVRLRPAVPVLLDDHHDLPAGRRALPAVERASTTSRSGPTTRPSSTSSTCSRRRMFARWMFNTMFIAAGVDHHLAVLRRPGGLRAGAAQLPLRRRPRHRDLRHLPGAADPALHPAGRDHPQFRARRHAVVADPHLSDLPHPVLHLADDGLLQGHPEGARGVRPHRRRLALEGDGLHHHPGGGARHPVVRHHRLHAVLERVHLRPGLPVARPTRRPCRSASPRS